MLVTPLPSCERPLKAGNRSSQGKRRSSLACLALAGLLLRFKGVCKGGDGLQPRLCLGTGTFLCLESGLALWESPQFLVLRAGRKHLSGCFPPLSALQRADSPCESGKEAVKGWNSPSAGLHGASGMPGAGNPPGRWLQQ